MDLGYYAKDNEKFLLDLGVKDVGLQRPQRKLRDPQQKPQPSKLIGQAFHR
jgi:hypothetical protein